jgi:hypothetical protein
MQQENYSLAWWIIHRDVNLCNNFSIFVSTVIVMEYCSTEAMNFVFVGFSVDTSMKNN